MPNTVNNMLMGEDTNNLLLCGCIYENVMVKQWLVTKGVIPYKKVCLKRTIILMCVFNTSSP